MTDEIMLEKKLKDWALGHPTLRRAGVEAKSAKETKMELPVKEQENEKNVVSWKPGEESVLS